MLVLGPTKEEVFAECDENGEAWVKGQMETANPYIKSLLSEWLAAHEIKLREAAEKERFDLQMLSINATKDSAEAARKSAHASRETARAALQSAKWTMVAAIAAFSGVFLPYIKELFIWAYPIISSWFY